MNKFFITFLSLIIAITSSNSFAQFEFQYRDSIIVKNGNDTLQLAWAGGINYGQFSDFDYDFDGDLDLFVFDRSQDNIRVFTQENTGNGPFYKLAYNSKSKFPANLRYRSTLVDYDNDGRKDLFTYGIGGLKVYRNTGDLANGLQWQLYQDIVYSEYAGGVSNLYISSSDIPAIVDVDNDGDIDVLTFHQGGYHMEYHQNQSMELFGIPDSLVFVQKNECWGKFVEDPLSNTVFLNDPNYPCVGGNIPNPERFAEDNTQVMKKHAGSSILALDVDDSGVLDLVIGDVEYTNMYLLINGGTAVNTDSPMISVDMLFPSNSVPINVQLFPAAYYIDVDFDGVKDLIVCPNTEMVSFNKKSVHYYKNTGTNTNPIFIFAADNFLQNEMIEHGTGSVPILFDYNEDGLEDLLVSNFFQYKPIQDKESVVAYYRNTGTSTEPEFTLADPDVFQLTNETFGLRSIPTFGDLDGDGDKDMMLGLQDGTLAYYENGSIGAGATFTMVTTDYPDNSGNPINSGGFAFPQLFDLDSDGLIDLLIGTKTGEIMFYQNIGTVNSPLFILYNPTLGEVDVSILGPDGYAAPHFFKENGETHLFLGSIDGELIYYNGIDGNIDPGMLFSLVSSSYLNIDVEGYSSFWVNNIDNDGDLNMLVGQDLGGLFQFERDTTNFVSVLDLELDPFVSIYPNPTDHIITISSEHKLDHYKLFDMHGKMILSDQIAMYEKKIDLSAVPNGFYFIQIGLKDGRFTTKKLIKQ